MLGFKEWTPLNCWPFAAHWMNRLDMSCQNSFSNEALGAVGHWALVRAFSSVNASNFIQV